MPKRLQIVTESVKKARHRLSLHKQSLLALPPTEAALRKRALQHQNQRLRQRAVKDSRDRSAHFQDFKEGQKLKWQLHWDDVKNERKNRREDWMLGPLAPMRDSGLQRKTYGTTSARRIREVKTLEEDREKDIPFMVGDRVVVVTGREVGKIGKIISIDEEVQAASVEGLFEMDLAVPKWMKEAQQTTQDVVTEAGQIPIRALRLVVPLEDPRTRELKDVVVKSMEVFHPYSPKNFKYTPEHYESRTDPTTGKSSKKFVYPEYVNELTDEAQERWDALADVDHETYYGGYLSKNPKFARFITGLNIPIPWPDSDEVAHRDFAIDTLRIEVEDVTHMPSLRTLPMPKSVIKELRNEHSRFRTRYGDEYLMRKERERAMEDWKKSRRLVSPEQLKLDEEKRKREEEVLAKREMKALEMKQLEKMLEQAKISGTTYNMAKGVRKPTLELFSGGETAAENHRSL